MGKPAKNGKMKSAKLHIEIPRANWERVEAYLRTYNDDEGRITPKIKVSHVINQALVQFLTRRPV
jgi:hypothetical protein